MNQVAYVPRPPLSRYVETLWAFDAYGGGHACERVLPTATSQIIVFLGADAAQPIVCGPHAESFVIDTATPSRLLGIHFRAGGAVPFLTAPADELLNTHVPLDALWGGLAGELKDRLLEARTWPARFRVAEHVLLARLGDDPAPHPAVAYAVNAIQAAPHTQTIAALHESIGISPRRFIELFAREVGLTPKVFTRVRRFQRVLELVERERDVDWADVALAGGYYDQAHLIHDFRAFSGVTPTMYARAGVRQRSHVPIG